MGRLPPKNEISRERCLRRSIFKQNLKNKYFQRFMWYDNPLYRLIILIVILGVLFLTYCYDGMGSAKDYISQEENNIYMQSMTREAKSASKTITNNKKNKSQKPSVKSRRDKVLSRASSEERMKSSTKVTSNYVPVFRPTSDVDCRMFLCFNYTRCPLTGGFPIYVYDLDVLYKGSEGVIAPIKEILSAYNYITPNPAEACIFLVITELPYKENKESAKSYKIKNEIVLNTLPHWGRDGRNHVLLNLGQNRLATGTGFAIIAQSTFTHEQFRPGFDVVIPPAHGPIKGEVWNLSLPITPARRTHFLSFQGPRSSMMEPNPERDKLVKFLQDIKWSKIHDPRLRFYCNNVERLSEYRIDDWPLCKSRKSRKTKLQISTFVLIIAPGTYSYTSTNLLQTRLYEALESGAIPVILGGDRIRLPYEEVLDWRKAVIRLPMARVSELKFILENMADEDILAFRKHGRILWERYLGSVQASMNTLLAVIRTRLDIPPRPAESKNPSSYDFGYEKEVMNSFEMMHETTSKEIAALNQLNVTKKQLTTYKRNFSVGLLNGYELWNLWGNPFVLYPELPWDPILPPEARYFNSTAYKHYHDTCSSLAGDRPKENFTVVLLTYDRKNVLKNSISRLSKLPYLRKIVVVCNGLQPSTEGWPTNVPIALVRAPHNSLNNRFLPYDLIETEAVFSVDDDAVPPMMKEIVFAFKVWREHRDQIVGFFGRNFEWNTARKNGFLYNTRYKETTTHGNAVCEVSMVLTGAAFIHRYYLWAYWRQLPTSVRQFVDKHKNCEDIAMNFLVAHITRKPPIEVTSKWAEKSDRQVASYSKLSHNSFHYIDRHKCMNFFSKVMGYNPLLSTHYRVEPFF